MLHIASALASCGLATCFVHYFDRTGHSYATDEDMFTHFLTWLSTLRDAVHFMAADPHVDPSRLACFGFSLGGYLALALAAQEEKIGAVVELAGGIDPTYVHEIERLPPTLILHGDQDTRVPVSNAYFLKEHLTRMGVIHEAHLYAGEPHVLSLPAITDAIGRSARFIQEHLGASKVG